MRETIHSGQFMVSNFEPESEAQDEEYEVGMPIPPGADSETIVVKSNAGQTTPAATTSQFSPEPMPPSNNVQEDFFMDLPNFGRNFLAQNFGDLNFTPRQTQFQQPNQQQPQQMLQQQHQQPQQQQQLQLQTFQQQQLQQQKNSWISIDGSLTKLFQCMSLAYR